MPGRRADRVGQRLGTLGEQGLDPVPLGHRPVAAGEHRRDRLQRGGVLDQRHAGHLRPGPRGSGRPGSGPRPPVTTTRSARPAATRNAATFSSRSSPSVVWKRTGMPSRAELAAEPLAVRVERLPADELAADRDDLGLHGCRMLPLERPVRCLSDRSRSPVLTRSRSDRSGTPTLCPSYRGDPLAALPGRWLPRTGAEWL